MNMLIILVGLQSYLRINMYYRKKTTQIQFVLLFFRFGRKPAFLISSALHIVSNTVLTWIVDFWVFSMLRFFSGVSVGGLIGTTYVMGELSITSFEQRQWRSRPERLPRKRKVWCSSPKRDRHKALNQVSTTLMLNARQQVRVSRVMTIINAQRSMVTSPYQREHLEWNKRPPPFFLKRKLFNIQQIQNEMQRRI